MKILGISCFYHDAAAALLCDGKLVAAAHEERFTSTDMDTLVLGNHILRKQEQPELHEDFDWRERYTLD